MRPATIRDLTKQHTRQYVRMYVCMYACMYVCTVLSQIMYKCLVLFSRIGFVSYVVSLGLV